MVKESSPRRSAPTGYILSQDGHAILSRVNEHLQLLDRMTQAHLGYDIPELQLTPGELLVHFHRIRRDMDAVIDGLRIELR